MSAPFRRVLRNVTLAHGLGVLLLVLGQVFWQHAPRPKPKDLLFVDLTGGGPAGGAPEIQPVKEVRPPEPVEPKVQPPPEKEDIPELVQKPKPKKKEKPKIERSTNLVTRVTTPKPAPPAKRKPMSAAEIKKLLAEGLKPMASAGPAGGHFRGGSGSGSGSGADSPFAWYYAMVRQLMYEAWEQPGDLAVPGRPVAEVTITVQRDGRITRRDLSRPSGNTLMDRSVMRAVQSVSRLKPLPAQFIGSERDIVIQFELDRGGL